MEKNLTSQSLAEKETTQNNQLENLLKQIPTSEKIDRLTETLEKLLEGSPAVVSTILTMLRQSVSRQLSDQPEKIDEIIVKAYDVIDYVAFGDLE